MYIVHQFIGHCLIPLVPWMNTVVTFCLEGKYWKRKLATVTAEYKRWRIFYKQQHETCVTTTAAHHQLAGDHFMDVTNTLYQYGTKVYNLLVYVSTPI